mgnify:CR=1 FL=1
MKGGKVSGLSRFVAALVGDESPHRSAARLMPQIKPAGREVAAGPILELLYRELVLRVSPI